MRCGRVIRDVEIWSQGGKVGLRVIVVVMNDERWGLGAVPCDQRRLFEPNTSAHVKIPKRPSILQTAGNSVVDDH
jgi:hypothetical protein